MKTIKVVNAAYSFAFEVYTPIPDGVEEDDFEDQLELNGKTLREALLQRLNKLSDEELAAACDAPWDSCIDEVDESKVNEVAEEDTESLADKVCNQIKRDLGWHEDLAYDFEALHEMLRLVAGTDGRKFLIGYLSAEEDTESFDRSFPELSNAAAGLMALKAMQDAEFGSKIADMIIGPLEK